MFALRSKLLLLLVALVALGAVGCVPRGYYSVGYAAGVPAYSTYEYSYGYPGYSYGYAPGYSYGYAAPRVYAPTRYYAPGAAYPGAYLRPGPHAARPYGYGYSGRGPVVVTPPRR